jgi:hypothetical protein
MYDVLLVSYCVGKSHTQGSLEIMEIKNRNVAFDTMLFIINYYKKVGIISAMNILIRSPFERAPREVGAGARAGGAGLFSGSAASARLPCETASALPTSPAEALHRRGRLVRLPRRSCRRSRCGSPPKEALGIDG